MILQIVILLAGLSLVVFGADWLVDGASGIARKAGISEFIIGLTIVGFGTSCPELVVSLTGAFEGIADISIGNIVGSNIFNTLLILGLTATLAPIAITSENKRRDIPVAILVTALFIVFGLTGKCITRMEGIVMLFLFAAYMIVCFKFSTPEENDNGKPMKIWLAILAVMAGLAGLIFGGRLFVDSAVNIARMAGMSEKFIAITILAGGTSMPELVTCIVAAAKHKGQLALGNILGSNVFNILFILGCSTLVTPLHFASMSWVDLGVLASSAIFVLLTAYTGQKNTIDRFEGALMLLCEAAYFTWLVLNL